MLALITVFLSLIQACCVFVTTYLSSICNSRNTPERTIREGEQACNDVFIMDRLVGIFRKGPPKEQQVESLQRKNVIRQKTNQTLSVTEQPVMSQPQAHPTTQVLPQPRIQTLQTRQ